MTGIDSSAVQVCPFFAARDLAVNAEIVFMPYNYVTQELATMSQMLDGAVLIMDEAHNVESACQDTASFDLTSGAPRLPVLCAAASQHCYALRLRACCSGRHNCVTRAHTSDPVKLRRAQQSTVPRFARAARRTPRARARHGHSCMQATPRCASARRSSCSTP